MLQRLMRMSVLSIFVCSIAPIASVSAQTDTSQVSRLLITEVKLTNQGVSEFVTIYNPTDEAVSLDEFEIYIEYAKPGLPPSLCTLSDWASGGSLSSKRKLTGVMEAYAAYSLSYSLTDKVGGSLRLVSQQPSYVVLSEVHWGGSTSQAPCSMEYASIPLDGMSLQRRIDCKSNLPVVTGVSAVDFALTATPSYGVYGGMLTSDCNDPELPVEPKEPAQISCEGVIISEVLPNPLGVDAGREYIELYNQTDDVVNLQGCTLQLRGGKQHVFGVVSLEPWSYRAFSDVETGLVLPNSAGATIWLVSAEQTEISYVIYPAGLEDDTAWALIDGAWQVTYASTPGAYNVSLPVKPCLVGQERNSTTNRCVSKTVESTAPVSCKEGQERNPETSRCRTIASTTTLTPCRADQERNPDTNRCRVIVSSGAALKPCAVDQERNPDTNRCRKVASASTLAACKQGQERNPDTNRCRKVTTKSDQIASVKDVEAGVSASKTSWYITGAIMIAAAAYAIYEWRQDIMIRVRRIIQR